LCATGGVRCWCSKPRVEDRTKVHLRIGRLLIAAMPADKIAERIFNLVNQFNRGAALVSDPNEEAARGRTEPVCGQKGKGFDGLRRRRPGQRGQPLLSLMVTLDSIRKTSTMVRDIVLTPLTLDDVGQLIADSVREERAVVESLARLVCEKSGASRRRPRPTPTGSR
jgi:hypothetical protein